MSMISKYILGMILFLATAFSAGAETYLLKVKGSPNGTFEVKTVYEKKTYTQKLGTSERSVELAVDKDSKVVIKAVPKPNFKVVNWTGVGRVADGTETIEFRVNGDKTVECSIEQGTN